MLFQEKLVQEALARQMPTVSLASMYPGMPMPMYGATPGMAPGMAPIMHVTPMPPQQVTSQSPSHSSSKQSRSDDEDGNYSQQLQSEYNSEYLKTPKFPACRYHLLFFHLPLNFSILHIYHVVKQMYMTAVNQPV